MSTVQNVGIGSPIVALPEPRLIQNPPIQGPQGQGAASTHAESQGHTVVADQVQIKALEARDAARDRAKEAKTAAPAEQPAKYASKVGLVDGTLDAFVDIVDARFQRKIARIFGPSDAPALAAEVPAAAVSKAYEHATETASGNLRQSA